MPPPEASRPSKFRRHLRRVRIATLLLALALVSAGLYLNLHGFPEWLRRPLLDKLRSRGLDLQMSALRLRFYRGLVAEDVKIGAMNDAAGPRLSAKEAEVKLSKRALLKLHWQVREVGLREGKLIWPLADTSHPARELALEKIRFTLRFPAGDEWQVDDLHATLNGLEFALAGAVTNASAIRDWPVFRGEKPSQPGAAQQRLVRLADALEKSHFVCAPKIRAMLTGDALSPQSFSLRLYVDAPDADTPWGRFNDTALSARLFPAAPTERSRAELGLRAASAQTPWGSAEALTLNLNLVSDATMTNLVDCRLNLRAARAESKWADITNALFTAEWTHTFTNPIPISGHGELRGESVNTRWASGKKLHLNASLATPTNPPPAVAAWDWWTNLAPFQLDWACDLARLDTEKLGADDVACAGRWRAPELVITNLHAHFPDGDFEASSRLDVDTREAAFDVTSNFDVHRISPLLTEKAARWLAKYSYAQPPQLSGSGAITLAAWTNHAPDWRGEVLPTLQLAGQLAVTNGAYLGAPCDWVTSHLTYTNMVWHLPDLVAGRPEGLLQLEHVADDRTHDYYFAVKSTIDPRVLRPMLGTNAQRGLDYFSLGGPPFVEGEVRGRWREVDRVGFQGRVVLTNFSFRGQTADNFETTLRYTNRFLEFLNPKIMRAGGTQTATAAGITADFESDRVYFTNGFSTAEPLVIARGIGPQTGAALEPYRFTQPPRVRVNGYAPLGDTSDADMRFDVDGGPFEWWKFRIPQIKGEVLWQGDTLDLSNITLSAYGGTAEGAAHFDLSSDPGTDFQFNVSVTNADLHTLMTDLRPGTNHLEGRITGWLAITNANSADEWSWDGYGNARLRDGLIWEIPIFGVLSKPLDALAPGIGNSRVSSALARFIITNGVIFSDTFQMRAPTMRLDYNGTVDFEGRVDAHVEAEPLRDLWGIGHVLSLALWPVSKLSQFKVTGTLSEPKSEPVLIPKFLFAPLHPFRTMEELFSGDSNKTNAPPVFKELPEENPPPQP